MQGEFAYHATIVGCWRRYLGQWTTRAVNTRGGGIPEAAYVPLVADPFEPAAAAPADPPPAPRSPDPAARRSGEPQSLARRAAVRRQRRCRPFVRGAPADGPTAADGPRPDGPRDVGRRVGPGVDAAPPEPRRLAVAPSPAGVPRGPARLRVHPTPDPDRLPRPRRRGPPVGRAGQDPVAGGHVGGPQHGRGGRHLRPGRGGRRGRLGRRAARGRGPLLAGRNRRPLRRAGAAVVRGPALAAGPDLPPPEHGLARGRPSRLRDPHRRGGQLRRPGGAPPAGEVPLPVAKATRDPSSAALAV